MHKHFRIVILLTSLFPCVAWAQDNGGVKCDTEAIRFLVVGDWGRKGDFRQKEVGAQMGKTAETFKPDFVISTGDNFYCCGVTSTADSQWETSFENIYSAPSLNVPWFPVLGNHDYLGNPQAELDYSHVSNRWEMPARYYSVSNKGIKFIFLDTSPFIGTYYKYPGHSDLFIQDTTAQLNWLDSTLAGTKEKFIVVIGHHPLYSSGWHGDNKDMIRILKPRLEKYNVNMYLSGHDHHLEYVKYDGGKTEFVISGAGSQNRFVKPGKKRTRFLKSTSGFVAISIKCNLITTYYINYKGKLLFESKTTMRD